MQPEENLAAILREGQDRGPVAMAEEIRIDHAVAQATERLRKVSESPRLDAELLLTQAIDVPRSYLFAHPEDTLDVAAAERFFSAIARRENGEPIAYLHGEKEFWSLNLMVSPDTLVPRPETEILVQEALASIPQDRPADILDLGTGSGAIALAIASERPEARVVATDISEAALAIARENARQLEIINVIFTPGDWIDAVGGQSFDVIVSNPPYVCANDPALESLAFEPLLALAAGEDGLDAIRVIAARCGNILRSGGTLLLEHGADQHGEVATILADARWSAIRCVADLAGKPRVTLAKWQSTIDEPCNEGS